MDLALLWCRPAATALNRPLAWEPPYAAGVALEKAKRQKGMKERKKKLCPVEQCGLKGNTLKMGACLKRKKEEKEMREADTGVDTETRETGCSCPQLTFQADTGPSARCPLTLLFHPVSSFPLQPLFLMAGAGVSDSPSFLVLGMVFACPTCLDKKKKERKKKASLSFGRPAHLS